MKLNYNYILFEILSLKENIQTIKIKKNNYILFEDIKSLGKYTNYQNKNYLQTFQYQSF